MQSNNNQRVKKFYVYAHYIKNTDIIFYIGVGTILNLKTQKEKSRYSRAFTTTNRNNFWKNVYDKYGRDVKILFHYETKEESLLKEKQLIEKLGRRWMKDGILTNISSGGEVGPVGRLFKMSSQQKNLLSEIKSHTFFIYDKEGNFLKEIKTIKAVAKYCGVTYNAIHSCLQTKNFSNGFFIFKEFQGEKLSFTVNDLDFKSTLSKKVITIKDNILIHDSIADAASYLSTDRKNLKSAIKNNRLCKGHKVYFKRTISSQDSKE